MEYSIKEIAGIIGADAQKLYDAPVSILLTDSRRLSFPEQSLFFALQTKTNDGHNYIQGLYKLRVRNFVVSTFLPEFESMPEANFLVVKDTLKALQKLAAHHRKRFNIPVIGITGSNGKTIVKEFLYQLLHNEFNIVRSPRSYNSQLGGSAVGMADERQEYIRHLRSRHFPAGRNGTPSTDHRTNHRRNHKHRGSASGELYLFHAEMSRKADVVQRLRSNHL